MSSPNPDPQNLQVIPPGQQASQPVRVDVAPDSDARGRTDSLEDRILTTEEAEALLRGKPPTPEDADISNADDPEQAQMVQEWMRQTPPEPGLQQPAGQQPPQQPPQPMPQFTPDQRAQMAQQGAQQPPPPQPPQPPQPSPTEAALSAQLALLQQQNQALMQRLNQPQPQTATQAQQQQPQPQPQFDFNVPDQYLNALASEDPGTRKMALNSMLNAVAEAVVSRTRQDVETRFETLPQMIQSQAQGLIQAQDVSRDMYGTYPELEPYRDFVKAAAMQIAGSVGLSGWSADVRDTIAERVAPMVPGLFQKIQANRAARIVPQQMLPGQQMMLQQPQPLPQGQGQAMPQWQQPVGSPNMLPPAVGGVPGAPASPQPVYVRDASGNLVPMQAPSMPLNAGITRPAAEQVDPQLLDIWQTLGYVR